MFTEYARLLGVLEDHYQRFRVRGRDDNGIDLLRDHLFDQIHLFGEVGLVLDAVHDEVIPAGVGGLVALRALRHRAEEFIRQRLHHERDLGFAVRGGVIVVGCGFIAADVEHPERAEEPGARQADEGVWKELCFHE